MSIALGCIYGSLALVIAGVCIFFGTLVGARGIFGFVTESGFSFVSVSLFFLWFLAILTLLVGFVLMFIFWIMGVIAFGKSSMSWYVLVDIGAFVVTLMLIGTIGIPLIPTFWWLIHFIGYQMILKENKKGI